MRFNNEHLLISNINFGLKEFKLLDFRKYIEGNPNDLEATGLIREAKLVNRGTRVIVAMNGATVVYDIEEDKISAEYDYNWKCNDMFCVYRDNVYVDLHNDKQFVLDGNVIEEKVQDLCLKDFRRYNIYQTKVGQLVLNDYLSNESNTVDVVDLSLALISRNTNMIYLFCRGSFHIYSIKEKKLVFSHTDYKHRYWNLFSDYALFNFETVELLHFNQKRKVWVKESHSLLTLLKNSSLTIQPSHSRDFILKLCRDTDRDHIVFNDWSKEKLNFKYFSSYPTEKRHHSLFDIELEKTCCEESRNDKNVDPQVLNKFNAIVEEYETEQKHINQIRSDKKITFTDLFNISK
ncbi:unnamed protein product [Bursaphelenchus okinawaensis]|uniref:Uncharacterized protein n=1 Tax=Bursaphelenchus okinawaensis TaxID=465554 RepID=A0A811JQW0_9BILA|nr:unnamed protein product [Bursaphelenchus okinawaensis]CAG9079231.1 unnamed protein product [Bursaphelenchus okinawaensis]